MSIRELSSTQSEMISCALTVGFDTLQEGLARAFMEVREGWRGEDEVVLRQGKVGDRKNRVVGHLFSSGARRVHESQLDGRGSEQNTKYDDERCVFWRLQATRQYREGSHAPRRVTSRAPSPAA